MTSWPVAISKRVVLWQSRQEFFLRLFCKFDLAKSWVLFTQRVSAHADAFHNGHEAVCWNGRKSCNQHIQWDSHCRFLHCRIFLLQQIRKNSDCFWLCNFFFSGDNCYPWGLLQGLCSPKQRLGFFWNVQNAARPPWWSSADWLNWHKSLACMSQLQRRKTYRPVSNGNWGFRAVTSFHFWPAFIR